MSILKGTVAVTRVRVSAVDIERLTMGLEERVFEPLPDGTERTSAIGVAQIHPEIGFWDWGGGLCFSVWIQTKKANPGEVRRILAERLGEWDDQHPKAKDVKKLKQEIELELQRKASPTSTHVEVVLPNLEDGIMGFIGTASGSALSAAVTLLQSIGLDLSPWAPWVGADIEHPVTDLMPCNLLWESTHGCNFLRYVLSTRSTEVFPITEKGGAVAALTRDNNQATAVALGKSINNHVSLLFEEDAALFKQLKVSVQGRTLVLKGPSFSLSELKLKEAKLDTLEALRNRVAAIGGVFGVLDGEFQTYLSDWQSATNEGNPRRYLLMGADDDAQEELPGMPESVSKVEEPAQTPEKDGGVASFFQKVPSFFGRVRR